ncbi:type II secretion system F family protein [Cellulomonas xylanilytica]|uniref:Membrane protein n=1 Tax=Cellulomonas xylanilytica TaxID=233583 RepID=A0A510V460_9CELL|nr:type II secretion system F family protein [Cellulomonas xylanilytica]GEK19905.1 membrane protein [Cellulomonas xylanilytica]
MTTWIVLLAGALVGGGIVVTIAGATPTRPDLAAAVERLLPANGAVATVAPEGVPGRLDGVRRAVLPQAVQTFGLRRYGADLNMLNQQPEDLAARKIGYGMLGLVFPALMATLLLAAGVHLPFAVPAIAGLVLGGVFFLLPDLSLRTQATAARASMRAATCVFLELVAMERIADAGPTEALDRAAAIGGSAEFARIRDALLRAELGGDPSWTGLTQLAATTGVTELGDLADIIRIAGQDGAAVYSTLRARAASLRNQLLATSTAKANAASEHMVVPVSLLGLCFMALLGYPAFVRILLS